MSNIKFKVTKSAIHMNPINHLEIHYWVNWHDEELPKNIILSGGYRLSNCTPDLTIYAKSLQDEDIEYFGTMRTVLHHSKKPLDENASTVIPFNLYLEDMIFNTLLTSHQNNKLPTGIWLNVDTDNEEVCSYENQIYTWNDNVPLTIDNFSISV